MNNMMYFHNRRSSICGGRGGGVPEERNMDNPGCNPGGSTSLRAKRSNLLPPGGWERPSSPPAPLLKERGVFSPCFSPPLPPGEGAGGRQTMNN